MTRALALLALTAAALSALAWRLGPAPAQELARAALTLTGAMISSVFLWLWRQKATPLALAMTFSWAGAAALIGWWLARDLAGDLAGVPPARVGDPALLAFLAVYLTGTLLHLEAIRRAFGLGQVALASVLGGALAAALLAVAVLG